jgi:hypothetical protein
MSILPVPWNVRLASALVRFFLHESHASQAGCFFGYAGAELVFGSETCDDGIDRVGDGEIDSVVAYVR